MEKGGVIIARKLREWYPGAIYHIMARGNHRQNIFEDEMDYVYFMALLDEIKKKYPFKLHSYCLMTNHFHMLLETENSAIWLIMKRMMQDFTEFHNRKNQIDGHLFQGRYKSFLVKNDTYFLQVSRYIHLNPVKARIVSCAQEYRWSSYQTLIGMKGEIRVTVDTIYSYFIYPQNVAYREFVEDTTLNKYEVQIQKSMGEDELWLPW